LFEKLNEHKQRAHLRVPLVVSDHQIDEYRRENFREKAESAKGTFFREIKCL